jgi:hypothetical protein
MKIKALAILGLAATLGFGACKSSTNTNIATNTVANTNMAMASPTIAKTNETATTDSNMKSKIDAALKAKGFSEVTVDTSTTPATLRGTYPKGKLDEVVATAQEANGGKPLKNEAAAK